MRQYAVIANLERDGTELYTLSSLPLHVTILSIFFSECATAELIEHLSAETLDLRRISTRATGRALFGVDHDIPVTTVRKTEELVELHLRLLNAVTAMVSFRAPQFTGDNFAPHITDQEDRSFPESADVIIENLAFVEIVDQEVRVHWEVILASAT